MGNLLCMGLFLRFTAIPSPRRSLDRPDDGLPARMDMDMLDGHLLLALTAMVVEGVEQRGPRAGELVRLIEALAPALEGLLAEHGPAVTFHRGVVGGDQLCRHHCFQLLLGGDADQRRY